MFNISINFIIFSYNENDKVFIYCGYEEDQMEANTFFQKIKSPYSQYKPRKERENEKILHPIISMDLYYFMVV